MEYRPRPQSAVRRSSPPLSPPPAEIRCQLNRATKERRQPNTRTDHTTMEKNASRPEGKSVVVILALCVLAGLLLVVAAHLLSMPTSEIIDGDFVTSTTYPYPPTLI